MQRMLTAVVLACLAGPAHAHFIFLLPDADKSVAVMVFSDELAIDKNVPIKKIAQTKFSAKCSESGTASKVLTVEVNNSFAVTVENSGPHHLAGICQYGVLAKGKTEPFLLMYYAKTAVGVAPGDRDGANLQQATKEMPLDIVVKGKQGQVLWQGKPLAEAEVVLLVPGKEENVDRKTDKDGRFDLEPAAKGLYAIRAKHIENKAGELDGQKYAQVRHYATLTFFAIEK